MREYPLYENNVLLELLSKDDELAFTEIYSRFWKRLFAIANNRLKDALAAEDIVHDVFTSLWANRNKASIEYLDQYLATAVKYLVLSKIKRLAYQRIYNNDASHYVPVSGLDIEASLHHKRILEIIKQEVENLPEKCRLIFQYSRNQGMPVKQIATELRISSKTVENQLGKALKQLKLATRTLLNFLL
jgi:RNA polymerase sigma-70 factor (family 1)